MVKLGTYAAASAAGAAGVVIHAFHSRRQFFPAMLYIATSKISQLLLLNMALVLTYAVWQLVKFVFLGTLREAEVERLHEQSWRELMEILFAMTIFREQFNVSFVGMVTILLFIKAFHWLVQKRVEYIETTPSVSRLSHCRIVSFMVLLLLLDSVFLYNSVSFLLKTKRPSVSLLFAFEYVILATSTVATFLKYTFYICDMFFEGQWESKAVFTFYLELVRDILHLSLYLFFFFVISINYGLPLHLVRELYETFRNFKARVSDFIRYRKITSNMNDRFPDATVEELSRSDATCIICREEMVAAKKLPCGHLFHVHCLRSWLERQQTCPTCRSPVLASEGGPVVPGGVGVAPPLQAQQQQEQPLQGQDAIHGMRANGQQQGQVPEVTNSEGFYTSYQAHLQAAATAAAQYGNSFVYPVLHARETSGYSGYMYLIPQAYLAAIPGVLNVGAAAAGQAGFGNSPSELLGESNANILASTGQEATWQSNSLVPCMLPVVLVPGAFNSHSTEGSLGLYGNIGPLSSSRNNKDVDHDLRASDQNNSAGMFNNAPIMAFLEDQQQHLQEGIATLQHQLKRIVDLQSQLNMENNTSHPPSMNTPSTNISAGADCSRNSSSKVAMDVGGRDAISSNSSEDVKQKGKFPACE